MLDPRTLRVLNEAVAFARRYRRNPQTCTAEEILKFRERAECVRGLNDEIDSLAADFDEDEFQTMGRSYK